MFRLTEPLPRLLFDENLAARPTAALRSGAAAISLRWRRTRKPRFSHWRDDCNPLSGELGMKIKSVRAYWVHIPIPPDGMIAVPDRPGLGITVRTDFLAKYTVV